MAKLPVIVVETIAAEVLRKLRREDRFLVSDVSCVDIVAPAGQVLSNGSMVVSSDERK
jgi:hypothetical protein